MTTLANRIISDNIYNYGYDPEGNLTSRANIADGSVTEYIYDHRNRLERVIDRSENGSIMQEVYFSYDGLNRRLSKKVNGNVRRFLYNGIETWADLDQANKVTARYLYGPKPDELLARNREGAVSWYLCDNIGSVREILSASGELTSEIRYGAYGEITMVTERSEIDRFLYTGREYDAETGLYYYRNRYFSPTLGRFTSEDPLGFVAGDLNTYRYVGNAPLLATDPSGLFVLGEYLKTLEFGLKVANTVDMLFSYGMSFLGTPTWNAIPQELSGIAFLQAAASHFVTVAAFDLGDTQVYEITWIYGNRPSLPGTFPVLPNIMGFQVTLFGAIATVFDALDLPCGGSIGPRVHFASPLAITYQYARRTCP